MGQNACFWRSSLAAEEEGWGRHSQEEQQQAQGTMTQWGWENSQSWRDAARQLDSVGHNTTLTDIGGNIPTQAEAESMIESQGGTVVRIEPAHPEGGVSTHTYPHIKYVTSSGNRATIQIQSVEP